MQPSVVGGGSKPRPPTRNQSAKLEEKPVGTNPLPVEKLEPELRTSIQPLLDSLQECKYKSVSQFSLLEMTLNNADAASLVSACFMLFAVTSAAIPICVCVIATCN